MTTPWLVSSLAYAQRNCLQLRSRCHVSWCNDFSRAFSSAFRKFCPDVDETFTHTWRRAAATSALRSRLHARHTF